MGAVTSRPVTTGAKPAPPRARGPQVPRGKVFIRENPLATEDPALAQAVERDARHLLKGEDIGLVDVSFHVCRDRAHGLRFICKVEGPPWKREGDRVQWRWWSPLMETAEDFHDALVDGLRIRRDRLSDWSRAAPITG